MKSADFEKALNEQLKMFPQILIDLFQNLADAWTMTDIEKRDIMIADYEKMDAESYNTKWGKSYQFRHTTNKAFKQRNKSTAERYISTIFNKIKTIGGNIIDFTNVIVEGVRINGTVVCEKGCVIIKSIMGMDRMVCHNVIINLEDPEPKTEELTDEDPASKDLDFWLNQLEIALDVGNMSAMLRAKQAIKQIKNLVKKRNDK